MKWSIFVSQKTAVRVHSCGKWANMAQKHFVPHLDIMMMVRKPVTCHFYSHHMIAKTNKTWDREHPAWSHCYMLYVTVTGTN